MSNYFGDYFGPVGTVPPLDPTEPVTVTIEVELAYENSGVVMRLRLKDEKPIVLNGEAVTREYKTTARRDDAGKISGSIQCPSSAQLRAAGAPTGDYEVTVA